MILAEDLLLLLIDEASGKAVVDRNHLDLALAGGVLLELATSGRVDVAGPGEKVRAGRLVVRDDRPTDDRVLDAALSRVAELGPKKPEHVLPKLARGLRDDLLERLIGREILRTQEGRILGVFPRHTWPAIDSSHEREVRAGLRDVLVVGRTPTPREAALIALLEAINQVPKVLGEVGVPARQLRRRAKEVAAGGFADEAVRRAVEAVAAATSAAILSAASAGFVS